MESQSINITIDNSEIDTNLEENPNEEMINEEQQTNNEQQQENNNVAEVIEEQEENRIPNSVFYILGIVLIVVFIHILSMLNKWRYQHQSNSQYVLYLYHLLDLLHIEVDEEYYQLALKARYANVPIEDTEAKDYEQYYHRAITKHVQLQPWYKKLVIRWLFP